MNCTYKSTYSNGQTSSLLNYKDGILHGHCLWWHSNGVLAADATFKEGQRTFLSRVWDDDRRLLYADIYHPDDSGYTRVLYHKNREIAKEKNYRLGSASSGPVAVGRHRAWWPNGNLRYVRHHGADGMLHGPSMQFFENGGKKADYNWMGGKLHGDFCTYYPNGRKYMEGSFEHGELHGKYVEWGVDGSFESATMYESGKEMAVNGFQSARSSLYSPVLMGVC